MEQGKKIRVLIVDDSIIFREILARGLSTDSDIEVVGVAQDPFEARDKILEYHPDVMTCDVEMPKMNGIEFVKRLLPQYPLPVIMVSALNTSVFDALDSGAVDFVAKPDLMVVKNVEYFIMEMIQKVKIASYAKVLPSKTSVASPKLIRNFSQNTEKIIAIGASTGGTEAIYTILKQLPKNLPGIVIVQHIPPVFSAMFAERLHSSTNLKVKEAKTGDYLEAGQALLAPGDKHMKVKKMGDRYKIECLEGEKVNGHCPSVDILFESVAKEGKDKAIGIILTGMGYDGAKGLLSMRRSGARTIGQDEATSVVYGMPKVAYNIGAVERQVPLKNIAGTICSFLE
ncbi:protein-glutamate methylesterase/protein-glutamine glutaminase [Konateibacter massiliensis]|uniref:protein-glutamate methylesterase/protein-glutamine glutaminase n=1 Tax=Konateibacter massiliensis TaxID=2002841 RepID=UPI000C147DA2|nr:chemotaxis response regulator protein-glutamate methylesterase [Konateibacter massiliensis]